MLYACNILNVHVLLQDPVLEEVKFINCSSTHNIATSNLPEDSDLRNVHRITLLFIILLYSIIIFSSGQIIPIDI